MEKDKPPILGLIQRGGQAVLRMLANVQQVTIKPVVEAAVVKGSLVHTDEYNAYVRLEVLLHPCAAHPVRYKSWHGKAATSRIGTAGSGLQRAAIHC
jgi:hypothetical protein